MKDPVSESLLLYQEELHVAKAVHLLSKWAAANKLALDDGAAVHARPQLVRTISRASSQPIINQHHHRTMTSTGKMLTCFGFFKWKSKQLSGNHVPSNM